MEERQDAALARINLFENAQSSIEITAFSTLPGETRTLFFSSVVDAADRGVDVRILLDGLFHNIWNKDIFRAFSHHPNIELRLYEPFDWIRPWTWNNRLHDKLIIVDDQYALIGGRNIGDRYYAPDGYEGATNDRDVMVLNRGNEWEHSVIDDVKHYFQLLWDHEYTEQSVKKLTTRQREKGKQLLGELRMAYQEQQERYDGFFNQDINWYEKSVPVNKIRFIHNPIERFNKKPVIWNEMARFIEEAEESIILQSPYVIPTKEMTQFLSFNDTTAEQLTILTNSLAASPNLLAYSGYMQHREQIANNGISLYEFQSTTESNHTKSFIFDGEISVVGSFNLDARSTFLNTESMIVVESKEFASLLEDKIEKVIYEDSLQVANDGSLLSSVSVEEAPVSRGKAFFTKLLSYVTRFFHHLL